MDPFLEVLLNLAAFILGLISFIAILKLFTIARVLQEIRDELRRMNGPDPGERNEAPVEKVFDGESEKLSVLQRLGGRM